MLIGENLREALANTFGLFQIQMRRLGGVATQGTFCNFYPHLSLETVFPALKLTPNLYKYEHFFFLKTDNSIINWVKSQF